MQKEDRQLILEEVLEHLAQAEDLLNQIDDHYLNSYVVGHINAQRTYLGDGLYQIVEKSMNDLDQE
jgi:hypothetical protein